MKGIYKITNKIDGRFYIGSSDNIFRRWQEHIYSLENNNHINHKLQNAFNKYGVCNFNFEVVFQMNNSTQDDRFKKEQYYLDTFRPYDDNIGYNLSQIAYKEISNMYTVVGDYDLLKLVLSEDIRLKLKENVNVDMKHNDKLFSRYSAKNSLSTSWYNKSSSDTIEQLRKDVQNYFKNRVNVSKSNPCYWTCNHNYIEELSGKGYKNGWLPYNARNVKEKRNNIAFLLNPNVNEFVARKCSHDINKDIYSLCVLVGWISSVANIDDKINVYIPSKRIREIFEKWLNGEVTNEHNND